MTRVGAHEAGSIEYRYRVPFGRIHVFIGKIGESEAEPDICIDVVEMARRARPTKFQAAPKHVFLVLFMERSWKEYLNLVVRRLSTQATSPLLVRPTPSIKFRMASLGVVQMVTVFRTPTSCHTGSRSSWPVHSQRRTLRLQ